MTSATDPDELGGLERGLLAVFEVVRAGGITGKAVINGAACLTLCGRWPQFSAWH